MDFAKLKLKFEPDEKEYDFESLKAKFEPTEPTKTSTEEHNWQSLKAKFEPVEIEDITTPAPATVPKPDLMAENKERLIKKFTGKPEVPSGFGISDTGGLGKEIDVMGGAVKQLPKQIKAAVLSVKQGAKGASVANKDWADEYIKSAQEDQEVFVKEMVDKYGDINILPGIKLTDIAQMPQSMAFSATSMGAGLAAGVPVALLPIPGSRVVAWGLGTVASGKAAYEMSAYQIMQTYLDVKNEEKKATSGQELTLEEENNLKQGFNNLAKQYALWEAVPEAISNLAFVGLLTAPLTKMVGKTIAGQIVNKVAGMYGEEILTETITEIGQKGVTGKAALPGGGEVDWKSPTEWVEAFKAVAPQTFLLTTVMGGVGTIAINTSKVVKSLKNEVKDSKVKEELIKKVENKETLQEVVLKTPKELKQEIEQEQFKKEISGGKYQEKPISLTNAKQSPTKATTEESSTPEVENIVMDIEDKDLVDLDNKSVELNKDGTVTLYHRTTPEDAKRIKDTGKFISKENLDETFFSNKIKGQAEGYGDTIITVKVNPSKIRLDDAFHGGEIHVAVSNKSLSKGNIEYTTPAKPVVSKKEIVEPTAPALPTTGKGKISKIAGSIEAKSVEAGITKGFGHLAEYTPIVIKEQAKKATDLINSDINEARAVIRGEKPLPEGLKGTALITAMEDYAKREANGELASELANSPLVSGTSAAAQELRLAAERDPMSPVKAIQDINKLLSETVKKKYPGKILNKAKEFTIGKIKNTIKNANTKYSWEAFIRSIEC